MVAKILEHEYPSIYPSEARKEPIPLVEEVSDIIEFAVKLGKRYFPIVDSKLEEMSGNRTFEFGWQPAKQRKTYPT